MPAITHDPVLQKVVRASATKGATTDTNVFTLSTDELDRDHDRITQNWNLAPYRMNPVVLFGHDRTSLPIGKCPDIRVVGGKLQGTIEWPPAGMSPFADQVHALVAQGFLRAASVGFTAEDSRPNAEGGHDITAATLLEWSIVNLPSNVSATLQRSVDRVRLKSWLSGTWRDDDEPVLILLDDDTPTSHHKEGAMRSDDIVLILKDDDSPTPNMPTANFEEAAALLMARAREIDASFRLLGVNSSIAALVQDMMSPEKLPQRRSSPAMDTWLKADAAFREREYCTRVARAWAAQQAVPESKRFVPGFQRTY